MTPVPKSTAMRIPAMAKTETAAIAMGHFFDCGAGDGTLGET